MKKIIIYFAILLMSLSMFTSCDDTNEPIILKNSDKFIAFEKKSAFVAEEGDKVGVIVYIAGVSGSGASVNFDFDTTGYSNPAVENVDFNVLNASKTLNFSTYYGCDTIWIEPIDNDAYDKDKGVTIVLLSPTNDYNLGAFDTLRLTVADNEHPLTTWIGSYSVDAESQLGPASWDESWNVTTKSNSDDETILEIVGISGSTETVYATVDKDNLTISIPIGSELGDPYAWGDVAIYGYNAGTYILDGTVEGTIDNDGTIVIANMAICWTGGPADWPWDVFNCTFTKSSKKGTSNFIPSNKKRAIK